MMNTKARVENVFIKFTGPAKTMAANQGRFQQLLDSFERAVKLPVWLRTRNIDRISPA